MARILVPCFIVSLSGRQPLRASVPLRESGELGGTDTNELERSKSSGFYGSGRLGGDATGY